MIQERWVRFPVRTVLAVLGLVIAVWAVLHIVSIARHVLVWILIALFLALALNPAVEWLQRRGVRRRVYAVLATYVAAIAVIVAIGATFVPTLVRETNDFAKAVPGYVEDLTKGKGRFGFLETKYHVVERVKEAVQKGDATKRIFGLSGAAISITKSVVTIVAATVTIVFLTFFMLLEGPAWMERFYLLLPREKQSRWRAIVRDIYRTVGGYVAGNLLISLIAGISSTIVLLIMGVPYAVALGLLVGLLDLIPLAGATIAAIIVATVAFIHSIPAGIVVVVFFLVYQQIENHLLYPMVYSRTVQLSPLAVLIAVLIGASLAGVLGALAAIPIAGGIQVVMLDWRRYRAEGPTQPAQEVVTPADT